MKNALKDNPIAKQTVFYFLEIHCQNSQKYVVYAIFGMNYMLTIHKKAKT